MSHLKWIRSLQMSEENQDRLYAGVAVAAIAITLIVLSLAMSGCLRNPSLLTIQSGGKTTTITPQDVQERTDLARFCRELAVRREEIAENMDADPSNRDAYDRVLKGIEERLEFCKSQGAI